jgi:rhodanese-related sulfurtransferase
MITNIKMFDIPPQEKGNKKCEILLTIVLIIIFSVALVIVFIPELFFNNPIDENNPTTEYTVISADQAYNITNSSEDMLIIDIRTCKCNYNKGHIPGAVWNTNPVSFYNETRDILIYDNFGEDSKEFCESLIDNVYGKIYQLDGGFQEWKDSNYPKVIP